MIDRMKRMWINQPFCLQPFHKYHGVNVLFDVEAERIYFLSGDSVSSDIPSRLVLSEGWVKNSVDAEEAHRRAKEAEEYNIGDALREVEAAVLSDVPEPMIRQGRPNYALGITQAAVNKLVGRFSDKLASRDPADFVALLDTLPSYFVTKFPIWQVPQYCTRYASRSLNEVAHKIARYGKLEHKDLNNPETAKNFANDGDMEYGYAQQAKTEHSDDRH